MKPPHSYYATPCPQRADMSARHTATPIATSIGKSALLRLQRSAGNAVVLRHLTNCTLPVVQRHGPGTNTSNYKRGNNAHFDKHLKQWRDTGLAYTAEDVEKIAIALFNKASINDWVNKEGNYSYTGTYHGRKVLIAWSHPAGGIVTCYPIDEKSKAQKKKGAPKKVLKQGTPNETKKRPRVEKDDPRKWVESYRKGACDEGVLEQFEHNLSMLCAEKGTDQGTDREAAKAACLEACKKATNPGASADFTVPEQDPTREKISFSFLPKKPRVIMTPPVTVPTSAAKEKVSFPLVTAVNPQLKTPTQIAQLTDEEEEELGLTDQV